MPNEDPHPILLPLDGSSNAEAAVPAAIRLARAFGVPVQSLFVLGEELAESAVEIARAREIFEKYAVGLVDRLGGSEVTHQATVVRGSAAEMILNVGVGARAIVLGTHGRGGVRAGFLGSVADKVVRGATQPTLAIHIDGPHELKGPILVALDGSPAAERGLASARDLAKVLAEDVALVQAWSIPPPALLEFGTYPAGISTLMEDSAKTYLAKTARPGEQTFCIFGSPTDAIAEAADKVDAGLVVLTSQGKGAFKRFMLGSTTDRALHSIRRPTLIIPGP